MKPKTPSITAVVAVVVVLADLAGAATPTERLRTFFHETNTIIHNADPERGPDEPKAAVRALVNDLFDFRTAARLALGNEWQARSPAEQEEFARLFSNLLERGYVAMVGSKARLNGGLTIEFVRESIQGDTATVATTVLTRGGEELPVDYRMVRREGRWVVQDVVIDGVGLVANYRAQLQRVMQVSSYGDLVAQIRERVSGAATTPEPAVPSTAGAVIIAQETVPATVVPARSETSALPLIESARTSQPQPPLAPPASEPAAGQPLQVWSAAASPRASADGQPAEVSRAAETTPPRARRVRYWVQLGAFKSAHAANRLAQRLQLIAGVSTTATPITVHQEPLARVRVGPFSQRRQAVAKLKELEAKGYRGFVVAE